MFQFDVSKNNWQDTKSIVATYDGFEEFIPNAKVPTRFFLAWNAPDGKIYICSDNATSYLHVIHYPNEKGMACQVEQHAIKLGSYHDRSVPNHPNYRLGPIDGSGADTLGLDNEPLAWWRYELLDDRQVRFTDNSWYEPEMWYWDFGDGQHSADTSPWHTYADTGWYHVCLTISNAHAADTFCRDVYVRDSLSAVSYLFPSAEHFEVYPNPASDVLYIKSAVDVADVEVKILDLRGKTTFTGTFDLTADASTRLILNNVVSGTYWLSISKKSKQLFQEKIVILDE